MPLCLNISHRAFTRGEAIPDDDLFEHDEHGWHPDDHKHIFDLFECVIENVIFAHTAVEAFANERIPDEYVLSLPRSDKKSTELYNREQIERHLTLDVKI